jgi:hypothetical protein
MANFQSTRSDEFKTSEARLSYVQNMFVRVVKKNEAGQPVIGKDGKEVTEQQCTLIFPNDPAIKAQFERPIIDVITRQPNWGGEQALARFKNGLIRSPILAGDGKEARNKKTGEINPGLGADKFFIRVATRLEAPVRYKSMLVPPKLGSGPDDIKSGDFGFAILQAYTWWNEKNGDGVSFGIVFLQKTRDGESLGGVSGPVDPAKYYEAVAGTTNNGGQPASALFG